MRYIKYHMEIGETSASKRVMGAIKGLGQRDLKGDTKDFTYF